MTRPSMDVIFNPEKHGYRECGHCNGYGSSLKEDAAQCTKCSGSGVVKAEPNKTPESNIPTLRNLV